jgi:hypothetical protein
MTHILLGCKEIGHLGTPCKDRVKINWKEEKTMCVILSGRDTEGCYCVIYDVVPSGNHVRKLIRRADSLLKEAKLLCTHKLLRETILPSTQVSPLPD